MNAQHLVTALYQKFGFSLMPLRTDDRKRPAFEWEKLQRERCTLADLQRWLQGFEGFGVITGRLSGIVVVDLDSLTALTWAQQNLPPTDWIVLTGMKNGFRGQHWYYRWNDDLKEDPRNRARIFVGSTRIELDWRGEGGYVVAPGSPHESGVLYEQTRTWTTEDNVPIFDPAWFPEEDRPSAQPSSGQSSESELTPEQRELKFSRWLSKRPPPVPGCRDNECYSAAAAGFDFGCSHGFVMDAVLSWNAEGVQPLPRRDVERTVNSAHKKRQPPKNPKGVVQAQQAKESSPRPAPSTEPPPVETREEPPIERSRVFIERAFVIAACRQLGKAHVLKSYPDSAFKDSVAQAAARAVRKMLKREEEPTEFDLGAEMAKWPEGWQKWEVLSAFEEQHQSKLTKAHKTAEKVFKETRAWDGAEEFLSTFTPQVRVGDYKDWISEVFSKVTQLVAESQTESLTNYRQDVESWCHEYLAGTVDEDRFYLASGKLGQAIGLVGPSNVLALGGDAKMGKTSFAWHIVFENAFSGRGVLVGGLELTRKEQAERGACWLLKCGRKEMTDAKVRELLTSGELKFLENITLVTKCNSIERYRIECNSILARAPKGFYRLMVTDQAEMLIGYADEKQLNAEANRGAVFFKEMAMVWDLAHLVLVQYKREYLEKDGFKGPRIYHLAGTKKYEKDCQAAILLHHPHKFDKDCPHEYIEVVVPTVRSGAGSVEPIPMRWYPAMYRYKEWDQPLPAACGHPLQQQVNMEQHTAPKRPIEGGGAAKRTVSAAAPVRTEQRFQAMNAVETEDIDTETEEALGNWQG